MSHEQIPGIEGRAALVTGAAGGIGTAIVDALHAAGAASVARWDVAGAPDIRTVDVRDRDSVALAWSATEAEHGPIDILVHAAGVMSEDWDLCLAVNATGARNVLDIVVDDMIARGRGAVVVISSNAGAVPRTAMSPYAASKAAATSYTRSMGLVAAPAGVRVNIVSPGSTLTPMLTGMWSDADADRAAVLAGNPEQFRLGIPLGRIADPADIAAAVVYLASDAARHVTLHDLRVDGGATLDM